MAIAPLFQRFVDDELELAPALVSRVLAGTVQLLGPSKDPAPAGGERIHYADLVTALQRGSAIYEKAFVDSLRRQVSEELDEQRESSVRRVQGRRTRADGRIAGRGRHRDLARDAADRQHRRVGAARAADVHVDAGRPAPRQHRIESVSAAGLRDRALGRGVRDRRLADPARDRPADVGRSRRRVAQERGRGGVDPARVAGRPAGPLPDRGPALGRELRASRRRAAAPGRADGAAVEHAAADRAGGAGARRWQRSRGDGPHRAQRRREPAQPRARAGTDAARRVAAPSAAGKLAPG